MSEQGSSSARAFFKPAHAVFWVRQRSRTETNLKLVAARRASTRTRPAFGVMGAIQDRFVASRWGAANLRPEIAR